jgi:hypothetical protein
MLITGAVVVCLNLSHDLFFLVNKLLVSLSLDIYSLLQVGVFHSVLRVQAVFNHARSRILLQSRLSVNDRSRGRGNKLLLLFLMMVVLNL